MRPICESPATYQVLRWLLEGHDEKQIADALKKDFPDAEARQALEAVMDYFATVGNADKAVIKGWCLEAYRDLYGKMVAIGDYHNAVHAIKELAKLAGI